MVRPLLAFLLMATPARAALVVVDFGIGSGGPTASYTEDGVTFTRLDGGMSLGTPSTDRDLIITGFLTARVRVTGTSNFDVRQLDVEGVARDWFFESSTGATLNFNSTGTVDFTGLPNWATDWANVGHFEIVHSAGQANAFTVVDNVNLEMPSTVPEPSTLGLALLSIACFGGRLCHAKRKRIRRRAQQRT